MIESKFKYWPVFTIIICVILLLVLTLVFISFGFPYFPLYISVPILLILFLVIFWLTFRELRTKILKLKIEANQITSQNFIGFGITKTYELSEFDGYKISILPTEYQDFETLHLMQNNKEVLHISQLYHANYTELKKFISARCRNLGQVPYSILHKLKKIFMYP